MGFILKVLFILGLSVNALGSWQDKMDAAEGLYVTDSGVSIQVNVIETTATPLHPEDFLSPRVTKNISMAVTLPDALVGESDTLLLDRSDLAEISQDMMLFVVSNFADICPSPGCNRYLIIVRVSINEQGLASVEFYQSDEPAHEPSYMSTRKFSEEAQGDHIDENRVIRTDDRSSDGIVPICQLYPELC